MIAVHESALDAIKAMGQRDKERIEELEAALRAIEKAFYETGNHPRTAKAIRDVLVNTYSKAIIQKAE